MNEIEEKEEGVWLGPGKSVRDVVEFHYGNEVNSSFNVGWKQDEKETCVILLCDFTVHLKKGFLYFTNLSTSTSFGRSVKDLLGVSIVII
jgi:hypothetical protein